VVAKDTASSKSASKKEKHLSGNRMQRNVYNAMVAAKDLTGRQICQIFMVKPDPDIYPDYYNVITEPVDLKMIDNKIQIRHGSQTKLTNVIF
jgi:protein polybromo-1